MDKLSNEISFSSDSPQQVEPVRGSGTSATSHLLLTNRINVRACHVRSGVAMQLNTKCQHKHPQGALQWRFIRHMARGGALRLFPVFSGPWPVLRRHSSADTLVSVHLPERTRLRSVAESGALGAGFGQFGVDRQCVGRQTGTSVVEGRMKRNKVLKTLAAAIGALAEVAGDQPAVIADAGKAFVFVRACSCSLCSDRLPAL
jgi:hypothetical protein